MKFQINLNSSIILYSVLVVFSLINIFKFSEGNIFIQILMTVFLVFSLYTIFIYLFRINQFFIYYFNTEILGFLFFYFFTIFFLKVLIISYTNVITYLVVITTLSLLFLIVITYGKKTFNYTIEKNIKNKVFDLEKGLYNPDKNWSHYPIARMLKKKSNNFYNKLWLYASMASIFGVILAGILRGTSVEDYFALLISCSMFIFFMFYLSIKIYGYIWIKKWEKENGRKMRLKL